MNTALFFASTTGFFVLLSLILIINRQRTKKLLEDQSEAQKHRLYELSVLKEVQDRIGYELDLEKIVDVIIGSLHNLFPFSTAASLLNKHDNLVFKVLLEEAVSPSFIQDVKKTMIASLTAMSEGQLSQHIDETISGVFMREDKQDHVGSFFNIPLVVNNRVVGVINVSSIHEGLYRENEMTILYQIVGLASTALSRLQTVLQTEKGKLIAMIGSLADGVFMVDTNAQLLLMNNTAKVMLGMRKETVTMLDVTAAFPKEHFDVATAISTVIETKKGIQKQELQLGERTIQLFVTPVFQHDGRAQHVLGASILLHDITLEKRLAQIKQDFTNMVVHELRAPLTAIRGAARLLATTNGRTHEEQEKLLAVISEQTRHMLDEVTSLLDAAKLESGKLLLQKAPFDLSKVIQEKMDTFTAQATLKKVSLQKVINGPLPFLNGDSYRIGQVITNLLSNSLKFTPSGGTITVSAQQHDHEFVVQIHDTGSGIPVEKQQALFSKFYQAAPAGSFSSSNVGTGLGLYISKGIVQAHGGTIALASTPGQGTTVTIHLPLNSL